MIEPVYHKLARDLESYFATEKFPGKLPGVRELSRRFEVSKGTLCKALQILEDRGSVRVESGCGITFLGVPDYPAPRHKVIGIAGLCGLEPSFLEDFNRTHRKTGFSLLELNVSALTTRRDIDWLLQLPIDGIILLNSASNPRFLNFFYEHNIPVIGCPVPGFEHLIGIEPDHRAAYRRILETLMGLGHTRIALAMPETNPEFQFFIDWILESFRETLGHFYDEELIVFFTPDKGRESIQEFEERICGEVTEQLFHANELPTALIAEQHYLHILREYMLCHDFPGAETLSYFAVTYPDNRDPYYAAAMLQEGQSVEIAFQKMCAMLEGKKVDPETILIPMKFFDGRSIRRAASPAGK